MGEGDAVNAPVIRVRDLRIAFGDVQAVDGVCFDLLPGRALGLVGESGSGKSATALALLGLHRGTPAAVSGQVEVAGVDLLTATDQKVRRLRGRTVAMVFQDSLSALDPYYPVAEQVAEVVRVRTGAGRRAARARAAEVLDRVGIPAAQRSRGYPHELSGGMRQRVLIAMALALRPRVLVADEPTTALDVTVQAQILALLGELRAETGSALLLVSHDLAVVANSTDEVLVMKDGQVVERGPVRQVLRSPEARHTRDLIAAIPAAVPPGAATPPGVPVEVSTVDVTRAGPPRPAHPAHVAGPAGGAEPLLRIVDLRRHFPVRRRRGRRQEPVRAVDGVSLSLAPGETLGIVGESGSGKTTLARLMVRLLRPTSGSVVFQGEEIGRLPEKRLRPVRRDLQMIFQDPVSSLNPRRTVGESIADPLCVQGERDERRIRARVRELLERVGLLPGHYDHYPHQLSGGQRQRVGIARALVLGPRLIICDEPVSALDVTTQAQVLGLLNQLQRELGLTLVFVSHDLAVVRQVSDRVAVMRAGQVVELAAADTLYRAPAHPYTRQLLAAVPVLDRGPMGGPVGGADSEQVGGPGTGPGDGPDSGSMAALPQVGVVEDARADHVRDEGAGHL